VCGIAGCIRRDGREPDRGALEAMARALHHRGPDDIGVEVVGPVGLVHRRLSIVDLSDAGHAPMQLGEHWLTYNGEVFNHAALREELSGPWTGHSDTETVLHALAEGGTAALGRFDGFWGLAWLDGPGRRLVLSRDRFGVKPLFVARTADAIWFASEMKALLAAGVPARPNVDAIRHMAHLGWVNGPETGLRDVTRLMPGTALSISLDGLAEREERWFDPPELVDRDRARSLARRSRDELRAELAQRLSDAVGGRLMGDVPIATMCSGGIDSSLVAAYAIERSPTMVAYTSSIVDQPENDEHAHASAIAAHIGARLETIEVTAESWLADFVPAVWHLEHPLLHPGTVPMMQIARHAHANGIKVLLSGEGADELFGGYGAIHQGQRRDFAASGPQAWARELNRRLRPGTLGQADFEVSASERANAFVAQARAEGRRAYRGVLPRRGAAPRGIDERLAGRFLADFKTYLPSLLHRQDTAAMSASVEVREPFLDPSVLRFGVNLPMDARAAPELKGILRELALERLPRSAIERPKMGWGFNAGRYLHDVVRPDALLDGALRETLGESREEWASGFAAPGRHSTLFAWSAEAWCRLFLEGKPVETVEGELLAT
jgi:asparagine synthase (glutamine-hydrolysing)